MLARLDPAGVADGIVRHAVRHCGNAPTWTSNIQPCWLQTL